LDGFPCEGQGTDEECNRCVPPEAKFHKAVAEQTRIWNKLVQAEKTVLAIKTEWRKVVDYAEELQRQFQAPVIGSWVELTPTQKLEQTRKDAEILASQKRGNYEFSQDEFSKELAKARRKLRRDANLGIALGILAIVGTIAYYVYTYIQG
jgi:hypothetical protein